MEDEMAEERKITGSISDMWMNYLPCPSLCRQCKHFEKKPSNWPFHCHEIGRAHV